MALKNYNPTSPGPRAADPRRQVVAVEGQAGQGADRRQAQDRRPQQQGPRHRRAASPAATSRSIASSTSSVASGTCRATVERLEYDPNRTAFIALVKYEDGEQAYILAPQRLAVGDTVVAGEKTDVKPGNAMPLGQMPVGTIIHNVEMKPGKGGQIARSAGTYVQLVGRDRGMVIVRLNSGEQRYLRGDCMGTVGAVSNPDNQNQNFGKAGRNRWHGPPSARRGVAKNPVDHPHGGGEGRTSGGRHPVTPWGKPTKGADPHQQADGQDDHPFASREEEEVSAMARSVWKGPFVDCYLLKKAEAAQDSAPAPGRSRPGRAVRRSCRSSSA